MSVFIVDSNFFIQAHRVSYPLDVAYSFWNKVKQLADSGFIMSIDKVKDEIFDNHDLLSEWCEANLPDDFFHDTASSIESYRLVTSWVVSRSTHYLPNAINEFLSAEEADAFIVAYALDDPSNNIIVTQEVSEPFRRNKVKIPDACDALGVRYVNMMDMFRLLSETF
ncbi:MAG: DUF4411 family protein [Bacteroidales bacterium]|jgi:hypothetical protein|nr:DUF4411 family protein [Bacteroidales bacterium]NMD03921.1 DUF4411 family protein [Bacteroidales bacterium]OQB60579.1 MAG: hypothetical protein BWX96_02090 [Bacteroidetes bacterium ADurb.Bin145]HOU02498.1 DUF4411 family protein [Bacteroidales bacterium]HQK68676.1 DUF4411 family protein [Bacteroidales bacterium]